jgi:hypothetical protein
MPQASPLNTATAVGAGAVVAPVVSYVASLFHLALPADVQASLVVLIVAGAHWLSQNMPSKAKPAAPAQ